MTSAKSRIQPVILCGGSGTRLWPLSRGSFPKQFVPLINGKSLLELTCERAKLLNPRPGAVAAEAHRFLVQECADAAGIEMSQILEPAARNTAPAMCLAALEAAADDLLLFLPADHYVPDAGAFAELARRAADIADTGRIVTFGVVPRRPSTAYGYIRQGAALPGFPEIREVAAFVEKPAADKAIKMVASGEYLWNAGIFLCRADVLLQALEKHAPDILAACRDAMRRRAVDGSFIRVGAEAFTACRSQSIDYAVMEKAEGLVVLPFRGEWSDVGSWTALAELTPADAQGNRVEGAGRVFDTSGTYLRAQTRPVVAVGVENVIIVETPDAVLVVGRDSVEEVKGVVAEMERAGIPEATQQRRDARPWGAYDIIDAGERFKVKRITVKPGARLSLQRHYHRAEHWIVVRGTARVTKGDEHFLLTEDQSTYIPHGYVHSLENPGKVPLEMIEVQSGEYLGEDDIERLEDSYGRK